MATPFASVADLEDSLRRPLTSAERPAAVKALRYASNLVRAIAPWVDSLTVVPEPVVDAVSSMALRRFTARVDGATSQTVGNVAVSYDRGSSESFTPDEQLLIRSALGMTGATTVSLAGPVVPVVP